MRRGSGGLFRRGRRVAVSAIPTAIAALMLMVVSAAPAGAVPAGQPSGQRAFASVSVEPAINSFDGSLTYLITPVGAPLPSKANPVATAPLYLPVYPPGAPVETNGVQLNCHPDNCDHANILPGAAIAGGPLEAVYPVAPADDPTCAHFDASNGNVDGSGNPLPCVPLLGHDHLVGVPPTGDWNVAWDVHLVLFTSVPSHAIRTLSELSAMFESKAAIDAGSIVTFNCSRVPAKVYNLGTPLSF